jgi:Domain of unknown function (DUF4365)
MYLLEQIFMKRPKQHIMETESEQLLEQLVPSSWIIRSVSKDYGVDKEIELVDQNIVSGKRIWLQLKSVEKINVRKQVYKTDAKSQKKDADKIEVDYISFSMDVDTLKYYLSCTFPVLLFLADLENKEIYWLPIQDEIEINLFKRTPNWTEQKSTTLQIPIWNRLTSEKENNYPGLRWYSLEPARMYAFARIHHFYHESQYYCRLSGYSIGDGWIDDGEEKELKSSLVFAKKIIKSSLNYDVLFGLSGIDFLILSVVPQFQKALESADFALEMLSNNQYKWNDIAREIGYVFHAVNLLSITISMYQDLRQKYLFSEEAAVWGYYTNNNSE